MKKKIAIVIAAGIILVLGSVYTPLVSSANAAADLDQIRNGPYDDPLNPAEWENGNAGGQNAHYIEGYSIPYRCIMTDLPIGTPITITFEYEIKHGGRHAIDFLTNYSRMNYPSHNEIFGHSMETVDPLDGISGVDGTRSYFVIPAPNTLNSPVVGQPTISYNNIIINEGINQVKMACFGGIISDIYYVNYGVLTDANSNASINVTFTASSSTIVLAWGGHIASRADWGFDASGKPRSAGGIHGSPYHMRLFDWTLGNLGNQDRSLKTDAIFLPKGKIIVCKNTIPDTDTTTQFTFSTDYDTPFNLHNKECNDSKWLNESTYNITEGLITGWDLTDIQVDDPTGGAIIDLLNRTVEVNLAADEIIYVNFTNTQRGCLEVTKIVDWNGATPIEGQTFEICITGPSYLTSDCMNFTYPGNLSQTWCDLIPGEYTITEPGISAEWSVLINGSSTTSVVIYVHAGSRTTNITVRNTKVLGCLDVTKIVNWNGVTPIPSTSFEITVTGPSYPSGHILTFNGTGIQTLKNLTFGWYYVNETNPGSEWIIDPGLSQSVYVSPGQRTCNCTIITNTYNAGCLEVTKSINWNGVTPIPSTSFEITVTGPSYPSGHILTFNGTDTQILKNLTIGWYYINETNPGSEWIIDPGLSQSVYVSPGQRSCNSTTITNTYKAGCLEVTKNINWNGVTPIPGTSFEITVTGPSYPNGHILTFNKSETQTLNNLLLGWYWVNETAPGTEWIVTPGLSQNVYVNPVRSSCNSTTITNAYDAGCLVFTKELWWNGAAPTGQQFTITIEGPNGYHNTFQVNQNGQGPILMNLQVGTYWVNETDPGNDWIVTPGLSQQVTVHSSTYAAAGCVCAKINNTYQAHPGINIDKTADKTIIYPGENITYYYWINNTGNIRLQITSLLDDLLGDILNDPTVQLIGDSNNDSWLDTNETWIYSITQHWNVTKTLFTLKLPTVPVTINVVNGTVSYYDLTLSGVPAGDYDVRNGHYLDWCIDRHVVMPRGIDHLVTLYSSYDPNLPPIVQSENWSKVNYILNHKNGYDKTAIQDAIWYFINHLPTTNPDALALIDDANENGTDFKPYVGQIIGVITVGSCQIQNTIFEVRLPDFPITNNVYIDAMNPFDGKLKDSDSLTVWVRSNIT